VLAKLRDWFDHRTGYRKLIAALLIEHIPGGAKWRYVWGSCLAFVFLLQLVTGVLLMTAYSPGDSTAWSSVYFIQYQMDFGWLIRGLHHFGSQTMVVLIGLHMLQVVIAGAHLPPREINWWLGLLLLGAVLGLSLTGYLLPWDQKGYYATQVATNIAGNLPVAGPWLQKVIVGGPAYGHQTLTRFYALHVGILPPLVIVLTVLHLTVFRRHGVTTPRGAAGEGWFWPDQAFRDLVVSLVIFGIMLGLVVYGHGHKLEAPAAAGGEAAAAPGLYDRVAHAGRAGLGANLDAPADPARPYPARPEWYFLFLFQLLKYFEGEHEVIGTVLIPTGVVLLLAALPLLGHGRLRPFGHVFGVVVVTGLLVGVACLTCLAVRDDLDDLVARELVGRIGTVLMPAAGAVLLSFLGLLALLPRGAFRSAVSGVGMVVVTALLAGSGVLFLGALGKVTLSDQVKGYLRQHLTESEEHTKSAKKFLEEVGVAEKSAGRAINLASAGVPADGAVYLLRRDPLTQGPKLFEQHCATCHTYGDEFRRENSKASDLAGFGTEEWVRDLLRDPDDPRFFGRTALKGKTMSSWVKRTRARTVRSRREKGLDAEFDTVARWLGGHPRRLPEKGDTAEYVKGYQAFEKNCLECHRFAGTGGGSAPAGPDFTGYGDAEWLRQMVMAPHHPTRYADRNTMPVFLDRDGPAAGVARENLRLTREMLLKDVPEDDAQAAQKREAVNKATEPLHLGDVDRELIIRWLLKDDRVVFGGEPIAGPPRRPVTE
jgi:quinol-cytochrome oxidoreductase complex cytochrome b subunit/mono/diheme cytochrome c family protein